MVSINNSGVWCVPVLAVLCCCLLASWRGAEASFQSLPLQYVMLGCKGQNDIRNLARLSRVCEDCYALYKDHEIPVTCRENCFNNGVFDQCVRTISKEHLIEELLVLAQEIGQKPLMDEK